ncbi:MAG TPA: host attachment protein [Polyangiaceae bacterium]|nr:host attachment protein [Polyangiaceae bacterium]
MSRTCILVADRARARFLVPERLRQSAPFADAVRLRELQALVDPEGEMTGNEVFSNTRSGSNRAPRGATFEYDDHRTRHREEVERRFAAQIAEKLADFVRERGPEKVVLVVEPRMLGLLRPRLWGKLPAAIETFELPEDLSWHAPSQIQAVLKQHGALSDADHE